MTAWIGQYCIFVRDLDESVKFYEALGLSNTSRTDLGEITEAIVENPEKGGKLQLAQKLDQNGPIDMGNAFWKLYVATNDPSLRMRCTASVSVSGMIMLSVRPARTHSVTSMSSCE